MNSKGVNPKQDENLLDNSGLGAEDLFYKQPLEEHSPLVRMETLMRTKLVIIVGSEVTLSRYVRHQEQIEGRFIQQLG